VALRAGHENRIGRGGGVGVHTCCAGVLRSCRVGPAPAGFNPLA
jgi:hypothetical protein